jgi:very-short-patch-repair endonuclease
MNAIGAAKDADRSDYLRIQGIHILRMENDLVWSPKETLLDYIQKFIGEITAK